jgi:hypothetical protein
MPRKPSRCQIAETNEQMLRRQQQFRLAAEYAARAFAGIPGVEKVALFGSVAQPLTEEVPRFREYRRAGVAVLHECKDVDIAVWLSDLACVTMLRRARGQCVNDLYRENNVGVAHHQFDVFLLEHGSDRYLGRLCIFGTCPKDGKLECLVPGCGETPFVRQHEDFTLPGDALLPERIVVLHDGGGLARSAAAE